MTQLLVYPILARIMSEYLFSSSVSLIRSTILSESILRIKAFQLRRLQIVSYLENKKLKCMYIELKRTSFSR